MKMRIVSGILSALFLASCGLVDTSYKDFDGAYALSSDPLEYLGESIEIVPSPTIIGQVTVRGLLAFPNYYPDIVAEAKGGQSSYDIAFDAVSTKFLNEDFADETLSVSKVSVSRKADNAITISFDVDRTVQLNDFDPGKAPNRTTTSATLHFTGDFTKTAGAYALTMKARDTAAASWRTLLLAKKTWVEKGLDPLFWGRTFTDQAGSGSAGASCSWLSPSAEVEEGWIIGNNLNSRTANTHGGRYQGEENLLLYSWDESVDELHIGSVGSTIWVPVP